MDVEHVSVRDGYDRWAPLYDHDGNPLVALDERVTPRLIGEVRGLHIADLACGTGRHTDRLVRAGARVTAVDFSEGMLARARSRVPTTFGPVAFVRHDLTTPLPFADSAFDGAVCALALEHVSDLAAFFAEIARVVCPGGFVVFADMHPAMRLRGVQANFDVPATGAASVSTVRVAGFDHAIADYVMAAVRAGLAIDAIEEHRGDAALTAEFPRMQKYVDWPMLLALRCTRPTG